MDWRRGRRSDNVVQDSGGGGGFRMGRGLGLGGVLLLAALGFVFFKDPLALLGGDGNQVASQQQRTQAGNDQDTEFVRHILGSTEDVWGAQFQARGAAYRAPTLVLFRGAVRTACGSASSAVGPFYCPGDQQVYLDLGFFDELARQFQAAGDFAQAYVIAHEVGHHVQNLLGVADQVDAARRRGERMEGPSGLSVRQELQADCLAGVWANRAQAQLQWLEPGDVEEALNAASQIGDDTLQREARGRVMPDAFTHGTSAQRVRWFQRGFQTGKLERCDTFSSREL
jgi:predicted metalloprotease